jgi:hypothetical protein
MESHCSLLSIDICSDLFRENRKYMLSKALSLSLQFQRGETAVLMTISRKNSNLLNWTSCAMMEQKWYAKIVMSIFLLLMEAEATSTNIYVTRNIGMLKRLWLQFKISAQLW